MKIFFPSDALLGRNGGDEFCILLPNCTFAEADVQLQKFTKLPKSFLCHGKEHAFYISLGYAEYPTFASNRSQLMRCADAALYEIKLHGKNGCIRCRHGGIIRYHLIALLCCLLSRVKLNYYFFFAI
jgi:diguanylate cyclase (GGDEF)-like protein